MIRQFGALPYRVDPDAGLQFLLVTSRDTGRWVTPKGNPIAHRSGHQTAAQEAYEEAGAVGEIGRSAIGSFRYRKRRRLLLPLNAEVQIYPLKVDHLAEEWPEANQRRRKWFSREDAVEAVTEPGLKRLILGFEP